MWDNGWVGTCWREGRGEKEAAGRATNQHNRCELLCVRPFGSEEREREGGSYVAARGWNGEWWRQTGGKAATTGSPPTENEEKTPFQPLLLPPHPSSSPKSRKTGVRKERPGGWWEENLPLLAPRFNLKVRSLPLTYLRDSEQRGRVGLGLTGLRQA